MIFYSSGFFEEYDCKKDNFFQIYIVCNTVKVFTVAFDQFSASLLNKSIS